jgi:hypothetical protein
VKPQPTPTRQLHSRILIRIRDGFSFAERGGSRRISGSAQIRASSRRVRAQFPAQFAPISEAFTTSSRRIRDGFAQVRTGLRRISTQFRDANARRCGFTSPVHGVRQRTAPAPPCTDLTTARPRALAPWSPGGLESPLSRGAVLSRPSCSAVGRTLASRHSCRARRACGAVGRASGRALCAGLR